MNTDKNSLKQWMDRHGLRAADIASTMGVSSQTISHWRSNGVPKTRREYVALKIAQYEEQGGLAHKQQPQDLTQPLLVKPTHTQFRRWNRAALDSQQLIEDWAKEALDKQAGEYYEALYESASKALRVAEDPNEPYPRNSNPKKK